MVLELYREEGFRSVKSAALQGQSSLRNVCSATEYVSEVPWPFSPATQRFSSTWIRLVTQPCASVYPLNLVLEFVNTVMYAEAIWMLGEAVESSQAGVVERENWERKKGRTGDAEKRANCVRVRAPEGASLRRDGRVIGQLSGKGRTYRNRYRSRSGGNDHCLGRGRAILALFWAWECSAASMISRVWRARCGGELLMAWPAIIWPSSSTAGMRVASKFSA